MGIDAKNTDICWITLPKKSDSEWSAYQKSFTADGAVKRATVRFECDCTCALYINGEFFMSGTGRYPERVYCYEITSRIKEGENTLTLLLGNHYFQPFGNSVRNSRGYSFNQAALELSAELSSGSLLTVLTDESWVCVDGGERTPVTVTTQVTRLEYENMWKNAALWKDISSFKPEIPEAVLSVAGKDYFDYANKKAPEFFFYDKVIDTNMEYKDGVFTNVNNESECYIVLDFGHIVVGYGEMDYKAEGDITLNSKFDYSETLDDFKDGAATKYYIDRGQITEPLSAEKGFYRNHRRRAFRYTRMVFTGETKNLKITSFKVRPCLFPETVKGYFSCSDEILNRAWEVGKYTLHVNKQQEYESCPRNEMLFFAGDGAIDALIDMYTFGDCDMLNTSLSLKHEEHAAGIANTPSYNRSVWQWDYIAWRVVCIYNYFSYTDDRAFLGRHFDEAAKNLSWLIERMNNRGLLYQTPSFISTFSSGMAQVDWACSLHRVGENVFLNCLLYKALECGARLAEAYDKAENAAEWSALAETVKTAVNERLWDEERGAYIDGMLDHIAEDANTFAVLFGVAEGERAGRALQAMKNSLWSPYGSAMLDSYLPNKDLRGGSNMISPMMSAFECEAWFTEGYAEEGLDLLRRVWGTMLKKGATTFWEFTPNDESGRWQAPCHAWSAGCTYLLSAYILGIRQLSPNWKKVIFAPRPCDLKTGRGVVPTPDGLIAASWESTEGGKLCFKLALPSSTVLTVDLPNGATVEIIRY